MVDVIGDADRNLCAGRDQQGAVLEAGRVRRLSARPWPADLRVAVNATVRAGTASTLMSRAIRAIRCLAVSVRPLWSRRRVRPGGTVVTEGTTGPARVLLRTYTPQRAAARIGSKGCLSDQRAQRFQSGQARRPRRGSFCQSSPRYRWEVRRGDMELSGGFGG